MVDVGVEEKIKLKKMYLALEKKYEELMAEFRDEKKKRNEYEIN